MGFSQNGIAAVHIGCQEGNLDIVKVLQLRGASLDAVSEVRLLLMSSRIEKHSCHSISPLNGRIAFGMII